MANNKSKKNKKRPQRSRGGTQQHGHLIKHLCSVTDPFCNHANDARSPAGSRSRTVPFTMKGRFLMQTGTLDDNYFFFRASNSSDNYGNSTPNVTAGTFPGRTTYTGSTGTWPTYFEQVRVVSAGVKWHCVLPSTAVGGSVVVIPLDDDSDLLDGTPHTIADLYNSPGAEIVDVRKPGQYILPIVKEQNYGKFETPGTTQTVLDSPFGNVLLYVTGPTSTPTLQFELVIHYEGILKTTSAVAMGAQSAPKPMLLHYQKIAKQGFFSGSAEHVAQFLKREASLYASAALRGAVRYGAQALFPEVPGAGAIAGMLMDQPMSVD